MKKRILALLLCLVLVASMLPVGAVAEATHADHCLCGKGNSSRCAHSAVQWLPWEGTGLPDESGNWYLTGPVSVSAATSLTAGDDVKLCLNGQTVTMTGTAQIYHVSGGAKLTITDCGNGTLTASAGKVGPATGAAIYVSRSELNLYGGTITGFTAGGSSVFGGAIHVANSSTFNMYGGTVTNNATSSTGLAYGGGVLVNGTFNMYGGTISNNTASGSGNVFGGGVFLDAGSFTMSGGTISGNSAKNGGGVYIKGGTFTMNGGYIDDNDATAGSGGGVRVNAGSMTMSGGYIRNNTATGNGGGIFTAGGIGLTMSGGEISGNTAASNGGGMIVQGPLVMTGGEVSGNNVTTEGPGGVFGGGEMTLSGNVKIYNNTLKGTTPFNLRVGSKAVTIGDGGMGENAKVYITYTYSADPKVVANANDTDYSAAFYCDDESYIVTYNADKKLQLSARPEMTGISLEAMSLTEGQTKTITAKVAPSTALYGDITWASDNEAVVKVEKSDTDPLQAVVTGVAAGSATITVTSSKGFSATAAVTVLKDHKHCLCGDGQNANCSHNDAVWQPWEAGDSLPKTGYWYLTKPVNVASATALAAGDDLKLCLNGQTVTMTGTAQIYHVSGGAKLTITDCGANPGKLTVKAGNVGQSAGAAIYVSRSELNLYGGTITGFTAGGSSVFGGAIHVANSSTFNMYGGTVTNNATSSTGLAYGGGVLVNGTFNMYGGTISNNTASGSGNVFGGGVFLDAGSFTMSGGTISGNSAKNGGGVYIKGGTFTMNGGYIDDNDATAGSGGGVRVNAGSMTMSGGYIRNNTATGNGGGIFTAGGIGLTMSGGEISGNTAASNGGGMIVQGPLVMTGGEVSGNNVTTEGPGGVFGGGEMTLSGNVKIYNNTLKGTTPFNLRVGSKAVTIGDGGMGADAKVYVTYTYSADPKVVANANDTDYSAVFSCDDSKYTVSYNENKQLVLIIALQSLSLENAQLLENETKTITAVVTPAEVPYGTITWSSSDNSIVRVEQLAADPLQADITGLKEGSAMITVASSTGISASCIVRVNKRHGHCLCADGQNAYCAHEEVQFQPWSAANALPTTGAWYLTAPVQLAKATALTAGCDLKLCLNGQTITATGTDRIFHVSGGAKLTITDCGSGKLTCNEGAQGAFGGAAIYVTGSQLNLYGGTITGFTATNGTGNVFGGAIHIGNTSTFNMYGGTVTGNTAGTQESNLAYGGGVLINGTFNMYGGEISGSKVVAKGNAYGGGVFLDAGTFNLYGGTISENTAKNGAGVYVKSGTIAIKGGIIASNTTTQGAGGGVRVEGGSITVSGGAITGNTAATNGGGIFTAGGIGLTMSGGTISGNKAASNGGGMIVQGALVMTGGEVTGNQVTEGPGGVFGGDTITLSGDVKISGNTAGETAYNLRVGSKALTIGENGMGENAGVGITYTGSDSNKYFSEAADKDFSAAFTSDEEKYNIRYDQVAKKLMLYIAMKQTVEHANTEGYGRGDHGGDTQWIKWDVAGALPTQSGHYFLAGKVELEKAADISGDVEIVLCLNGQTIDATTAKRAFRLSKGANVTICDCTAHRTSKGYVAGKITGATNTAIMIAAEKPAVTLNWYDGAIVNSSSSDSGSALIIQGGATFNMYGGNFSSNKSSKNGGAIFVGEGTFNLKGGSLSGNYAGKYGGAVYITTKSTFNMSGGAITGNSSGGWGGGAHLAGKSYISGGSITGNKAVKEGGGLYVTDTTVTMTGGEISSNSTSFNGGGICVRGSKGVFNLKGGTVANNKATSDAEGAGYGGGFMSQGKGTLNVSGGTVRGNQSRLGGGMSIVGGSTFTMTGGTVSENKAYQGAGMYLDDPALIEGGSIKNNVAEYEGGGMYANNKCTITMNGGEVIGNEVTAGNGGGICLRNNAKMVLNDGLISENKASFHAGGILVQSGAQLTMNDGTVSKNTAGNNGGGICSSGCEILINGGQISENAAGKTGAGIYGDKKLTVKNCRISGNKITGVDASIGGSAIMLADGTTLEMEKVLVEKNSAVSGSGAIHLSNGCKATISGCTFDKNVGGYGGALYVAKEAEAEVSDGVFTANTSTQQGSAILVDGVVALKDTSITGNIDKEGNAAVCLCNTAKVSTFEGNVIIRENDGGELLLLDGVKAEVLKKGLGDTALILLYLPDGGVCDVVLGSYNYEREGDIYTLTKGDKSITDPDTKAVAEAPEAEASVEEAPVIKQAKPKREIDPQKAMLIGVIAFAVLMLLLIIILLFVKKRKDEKDAKR